MVRGLPFDSLVLDRIAAGLPVNRDSSRPEQNPHRRRLVATTWAYFAVYFAISPGQRAAFLVQQRDTRIQFVQSRIIAGLPAYQLVPIADPGATPPGELATLVREQRDARIQLHFADQRLRFLWEDLWSGSGISTFGREDD